MKSTLLLMPIILVSTALISGCNDNNEDSPGSNEGAFSGHVVYHSFEGGFYNILTDSGDELNPTDSLPDSFKVEGLGVIGKYKSTNEGSIFMRGKMVKIQIITRKKTGG